MDARVRFLRMRLLLARLAPDPYRETCEVLDRYLSPVEDSPKINKNRGLTKEETGGRIRVTERRHHHELL